MSKIVGIDLGTTNSCIAFLEMGSPEIVSIDGSRTMPSVVSFKKENDGTVSIIVGKTAKSRKAVDPDHTISEIKRKMGTKETMNIYGEKYPPEAISAFILKKLKEEAADRIGETPSKAIITVPAYFNLEQRQATVDAGKIAGLEVLRTINEPTAAALAYGFGKAERKILLVYDLGGGTFDVTVIFINKGNFNVRSTSGDTHLGGFDFDERIKNFIIEDILNKHQIKVKNNKKILSTVMEAAEEAKIQLSSLNTTTISIPFIGVDSDGNPISYEYELTRAKFNELTKDLIERTKAPIEQALKDASLKPEDINDVLLVGGSTKIPAVQDFIKQYFGKEPSKKINPDEAVAIGAVILGGMKESEVTEDLSEGIKQPDSSAGDKGLSPTIGFKDMKMVDVISHSLGVGTADGTVVKIVSRNTKIPTSRTRDGFTNPLDYISQVNIEVYQGEGKFVSDAENKIIGRFILPIKNPKPAYQNRFEVTFEINESGLLNVTAKDLDTNIIETCQIHIEGILSKMEVREWEEKISRISVSGKSGTIEDKMPL